MPSILRPMLSPVDTLRPSARVIGIGRVPPASLPRIVGWSVVPIPQSRSVRMVLTLRHSTWPSTKTVPFRVEYTPNDQLSFQSERHTPASEVRFALHPANGSLFDTALGDAEVSLSQYTTP